MQQLQYCVMNYDWGQSAKNSVVAELYASNGSKIDKTKQYAELWLGTHVNGPSKLMDGSQLTSDLPYLFKILSIEKPLSIQSHPDKKMAIELHKNYPDIYKDANHKPEMAIAITDFEALCGLITRNEYLELIAVPEFKTIFNGSSTVKDALVYIMSIDNSTIKKYIDLVKGKINNKVFKTLYKNFGNDVGVLCSFLLKYHKLKPGQALFISPNVPHSYISGTIAEIMATSDNVIRAGCTTKYIDKETLLRTLNYDEFDPLFYPQIIKAQMKSNY